MSSVHAGIVRADVSFKGADPVVSCLTIRQVRHISPQRNPFGELKSGADASGRRAVAIALVWTGAPIELTVGMIGAVSPFRGACVGNRELK